MSGDFLFLLKWHSLQIENISRHINIRISTIDNPGWMLIIDLEKTKLYNKQFVKIKIRKTEEDWFDCFIQDNKFHGACGPKYLLKIFGVFRKWVEDVSDVKEKKEMQSDLKLIEERDLSWLQEWYYSQCDGDWEHEFGVELQTTDDCSWHFCIDLDYTELSGKLFQNIHTKGCRQDDWVQCSVEKDKFVGTCGPRNLPQVLSLFREWAEA